ncbi:hypothetical protein H6F77_21285 [Microcoleus sp. FACHB-831]|uniref:hypothetical protein n=1 Tax=Microcoleus sp. FACHB-831 TaxID=2692827 RepID=UPI0016892B6E|nr:hypothetical protein [Microcoleus sp. FACHB-831]MBD1923586.1 hypothetical protein [Microcoleus sp. FACHB-831]
MKIRHNQQIVVLLVEALACLALTIKERGGVRQRQNYKITGDSYKAIQAKQRLLIAGLCVGCDRASFAHRQADLVATNVGDG